jgi:hypothetical protein
MNIIVPCRTVGIDWSSTLGFANFQRRGFDYFIVAIDCHGASGGDTG